MRIFGENNYFRICCIIRDIERCDKVGYEFERFVKIFFIRKFYGCRFIYYEIKVYVMMIIIYG